jgi:hypothetical protein
LTRDNPNKLWTTYETNNNPNQLMHTVDADSDWRGGGEISLGYWWCGPCVRTGLALSYFSIDNLEGFEEFDQDDVPDTLSSTLDFVNGGVTINGNPASDYFDDAERQRISRENEIHNIELNLLQQDLARHGNCRVTWLLGLRYLKFDESLIYGSLDSGFDWGDNGGLNEAYLDVSASNEMVGAQFGILADYALTERLGMYVTPKIGLFGNDIETRSRLYDGAGNLGFDILGSKEDVSFLAQLDIGLNFWLHDNWRLFGGYRAIAVTGVALSDNQIPFYIAAADEFADPDTNGSLILHGAVLGFECAY